MADKRITELLTVSAIDVNNDLLPIVNNGATKKITVASLFDNLTPTINASYLATAGGTLHGSLSVNSPGMLFVSGGNSRQWNSVYTSYSNNSAAFLTHETDSQTLTFNETTSQLSILSGNTISLSAIVSVAYDTEVRALSSNWQDTFSTVQSNSAVWNTIIDAGMRDLSANWQDTFSTVQSNSALWDVDVDLGVRALSSNWQDTYTTVNANSGIWDNVSFDDSVIYTESISATEHCLRVTIEGKVRYLRLFDIGLELFEFATEDSTDIVGTEDESSVIFFT